MGSCLSHISEGCGVTEEDTNISNVMNRYKQVYKVIEGWFLVKK